MFIKKQKVEPVKVGRLRELINKLQSEISLLFKVAINHEFPKLLSGLNDDDDLSMFLLQERCHSWGLLNMYGVLHSIKNDSKLKKNEALYKEFLSVVDQIEQIFPDLGTEYVEQKVESKIEKREEDPGSESDCSDSETCATSRTTLSVAGPDNGLAIRPAINPLSQTD